MNNSALLLVDIKNRLPGRLTPIYNEEELMRNLETLVKSARNTNALIINVQNYSRVLQASPLGSAKLNPGVIMRNGQLVIYKEQTSAFKDTALKEELDKRNIRRLVVAGLVTQGCIKSTCLDAKKLGYDVVLAEDGHSNYNQNAEEVIKQWNDTLREEGIDIIKTNKIFF